MAASWSPRADFRRSAPHDATRWLKPAEGGLRGAAPEFSAGSGRPWDGGAMRVLVVDDDAHLTRALKRGLELEGFAVDVAHDGAEGAWFAAENDYDLMVLDIMLPGPERPRPVRRAARGRRLDADPHAHRAQRPRGRREGPRPRCRRLPRQAVLLRRAARPAPRPAAPRRGRRPTVLDGRRPEPRPRPSRRTTRRDTTVELTPRQFSLLEYLMRRAGRGGAEGRDPRARLGLRLRGRPEHRRGLRAPAPATHRPAVRPAQPADRARRRLPGRRRRTRHEPRVAALAAGAHDPARFRCWRR